MLILLMKIVKPTRYNEFVSIITFCLGAGLRLAVKQTLMPVLELLFASLPKALAP
jgi:hypothetical protein